MDEDKFKELLYHIDSLSEEKEDEIFEAMKKRHAELSSQDFYEWLDEQIGDDDGDS